MSSHNPKIPQGMLDMRQNGDINVFVGGGLGGMSLLNASVALKPDPPVFDETRRATITPTMAGPQPRCAGTWKTESYENEWWV